MAKADRAALERTVTALARLERLPTSAGEREAARWIARELGELGCRVAIEEEAVHGSFARPVGLLSALGVASRRVGTGGAARPPRARRARRGLGGGRDCRRRRERPARAAPPAAPPPHVERRGRGQRPLV